MNSVHWSIKLGFKLAVAALPVQYGFWRRLGLFRHGKMDTTTYARRIFALHTGRLPQGYLTGRTILELGPGDSVASAVIAKAHGVARVYLVDVASSATRDVAYYKLLAAELAAEGLPLGDWDGISTVDDVLAICSAEYLTCGLESLGDVPQGSIDFSWSHSVLEHVEKAQLSQTFSELARISTPDGYTSHNVDYQDHLAKSLNNLRFSDAFWESRLIKSSGVYTNRVRAHQMHRELQTAGFDILEEGFGTWPTVPLARRHLHTDFSHITEDELRIRTSHIFAKRAQVQ